MLERLGTLSIISALNSGELSYPEFLNILLEVSLSLFGDTSSLQAVDTVLLILPRPNLNGSQFQALVEPLQQYADIAKAKDKKNIENGE